MLLRATSFAAGLLASASCWAVPLLEMKARTAEIATRYLQVWSSSDAAAVEGVPYVYGPQTAFYGQNVTPPQLQALKRGAIRQWPVRSYVHRPGSMKVVCAEGTQRCAAVSTIDYRVSNPQRGTSARGSARFELGISFEGPVPRILYEDGTRRSART